MNFSMETKNRSVLLTASAYNELAATANLSAMRERNLQSAERALIEKDGTIRLLEQEIAHLREDAGYRRVLVRNLADKDTRLTVQAEQIKGMEQQIIDLNKRIETMKQTVLMLDEDRKSAFAAGKADALNDAFRQSPLHRALSETVANQDTQIKQLQDRITTLEHQLSAANQRNLEQARYKEASAVEAENLRKICDRRDVRIANLAKELREAREKAAHNEALADRYRELNDSHQRQADELRKCNAELTRRNIDLGRTKTDPNPALQSKINKQSLEITRLHAKVKELEGRPTQRVSTVLGILNVEPNTVVQMANDLAARLNQQSQPQYVVTHNGKYQINATTISALLEENANLRTLVTRFKNALKDIPQF